MWKNKKIIEPKMYVLLIILYKNKLQFHISVFAFYRIFSSSYRKRANRTICQYCLIENSSDVEFKQFSRLLIEIHPINDIDLWREQLSLLLWLENISSPIFKKALLSRIRDKFHIKVFIRVQYILVFLKYKKANNIILSFWSTKRIWAKFHI